MKLYIAGGGNEYGRVCFLVEGETTSFLVDCGNIPVNDVPEYPHLTPEQIASISCVFLTHSHSGHSGGLPWLFEQGYTGPVVASEPTLSQLSFPVANPVQLEDICPGRFGEYKGIGIRWGRSGHCRGAVWYMFTLDGKTILFSGDYAEITIVYAEDDIRHRKADFAVIDRGSNYFKSPEECSFKDLITRVEELTEKHKLVLFPVPKYGYGAELLRWLHRSYPDMPCYMDELLITELKRTEGRFWHKSPPGRMITFASPMTGKETEGFLFISDPQFTENSSRELVNHVLAVGGTILITSSEPLHTYGTELLTSGKASKVDFPVHFDKRLYKTLLDSNDFTKAIPYHANDLGNDTVYEF